MLSVAYRACARVTMKRALRGLVLAAVLAAPAARAQAPDSLPRDSLRRAVLSPVHVSVTRQRAVLPRQPFSISVVDRAVMAARPALDFDELLLTVPGVFSVNRQNPSQDIRLVVRGFGARSAFGVRGVRILLDGIPQTLPDGQGQLTSIDPADVARLEVLRGTASMLHGNASGGVIAVESRVGGVDGERVSAQFGAGAFGTFKGLTRGAARWRGGGVSVTAAYTRSDGFRDHASRRRSYGAVALRQSLGRAQVTAHVRITGDPLAENPGALTQAQFDSMPAMADPRNVAANAAKEVTQALAGIVVRGAVGLANYEASVYGVRRDLDNPLPFAVIDLGRWAWGTRTAISVPLLALPAVPTLTAGVDAQWQRDDRINLSPDGSETTLSQLERVHEIGPFLQLSLTPHHAVSVTGGMRYDRITFAATDRLLADGDQSGARVMASFSGAGGITVFLARWLAPFVSASTGFETPTTTELVNRPSGGGGFNPDVDPQHATSVEVGARGGLAGDRIGYEATYFDTRVRGELIPFEVADGSGRQFYRNAGSALHRGFETSVRVTPASGPAVVVSYTFASFRFRQFTVDGTSYAGNLLPGIPQHRLFGTARQAIGAAWVALDATWTSRLYADDANAAPVDGWVTLDVRGAIRERIGAVEIEPHVMVANVLDRRYVGSVVVNAFGGRYLEPAPGRTVTVGLGVRWP
ncbi:MAG TPA: TonB-dependent receptor [Gemmatimonadales bacterium]|jgi:iron complex outermembrane receptor protein